MKFIIEKIKTNLILRISLIAIFTIAIIGIAVLILSTFDFETIGATNNEELDVSEAIGKYIKYTPEVGTYSQITNNKQYTGSHSNNYDFITDTSLNWRVWSIDDKKITLVSDKPTEVGGYKNLGAISLSNCNGYNNAVKLLNDICKTCYSNNEIKAVSRSMNIDDIEAVLNKEIWAPENYKTRKTELMAYSGRKEYKVTRCYPVIYKEERYSNIDNIEKEEGIERSFQNSLYEINQNYLKADEKLNPLQTAWTKTKMSEKNFTHSNYYYLIFKNGFDNKDGLMSYFLASRAVDLNENNIDYDIFEVSSGNKIHTNTVFNSRGGSLEYWDRLRPMVEIPLEEIVINSKNNGMTKDTAWVIEKK